MRNSSRSGLSDKLTKTNKRVLLIGERFLLLDALRLALSTETLEVAAVGTNQQSVEEAVRTFEPDVVVFDGSGSPGERIARTVRWLKESSIVVGIASVGMSVEAAGMLSAGAEAVLGLDAGFDELTRSLQGALAGQPAMPQGRRYDLETLLREHRASEENRWQPFHELSPRERDIFAMVYDGLSADQIAEDACVSVSTVRTHVRSILFKLNVHSQLAAVAMARSNNWFTVDSVRTSS
jgi:DNA-binding NarL/FixJ family response regulator